MRPILNGVPALQYFECGDAIKICNGLISTLDCHTCSSKKYMDDCQWRSQTRAHLGLGPGVSIQKQSNIVLL